MSKFQKGDLVELLILEHEDDPKRYCIQGRFKGVKGMHILARIGEGENDIRSPETIRQTTEYLAKEIQDTYALNARLRSITASLC